MKIVLYGENEKELQQLTEYLEYCGRTEMRQVDVASFSEHVDFCRAVRDGTGAPDLFVIALDGTSSLEIMEMVRSGYPDSDIIWFSDLDFAVRSYLYGTLWFGQKPVRLEDMQKAFRRKVSREKKIRNSYV